LAFFDSSLEVIRGHSPVPSENSAARYKENGGNTAFVTMDCRDFADDSRGRGVSCLASDAGGNARHYSCIISARLAAFFRRVFGNRHQSATTVSDLAVPSKSFQLA
jgi:hypothetical protein